MMHGLSDKADTWIKHYPEVAPAFVLAREGYDVWLGNNRGTDPSYKHLEYDPINDGEKFWNFSWQELGRYDLPAFIEKVLYITGQ